MLQICAVVGLTGYLSLRNGQRNEKICTNIHECLDSTLLILQYRLKAVSNRSAINIIKQYGNIQEIKCFPGLLNQVFMNSLANAIDALEDIENPSICISTAMIDSQFVEVRIADNGIGISESVKHNLFQPLFTTKPMGKGTGLGLSIARQIIEEKHSGQIYYESVTGQGSEFIFTLPVSN